MAASLLSSQFSLLCSCLLLVVWSSKTEAGAGADSPLPPPPTTTTSNLSPSPRKDEEVISMENILLETLEDTPSSLEQQPDYSSFTSPVSAVLTDDYQDLIVCQDEEVIVEHLGEPGSSSEQHLDESSSTSPAAAILTDDLRGKIVRQVEYYFSDENLRTDQFLLTRMRGNKQGFVPIAIIASFRKIKKLVQNTSQIEAALRTSLQLVVSPDGSQVKRLHPMPECANTLLVNLKKEAKVRTVLVKNLPEDQTIDDVRRLFGNIGKIKDFSIQDLNGKRIKIKSGPIGQKVFIEYETIEATKDAVSALNDETNWRSGMRVELLHKSKEKQGTRRKGISEPHTLQLNSAGVENVLQPTDPNEETVISMENLGSEEKSKQKIRDKKYCVGDRKQSSRTEVLKNPPPMPKMPDGTRGFTVGRGKPIDTRTHATSSTEDG